VGDGKRRGQSGGDQSTTEKTKAETTRLAPNPFVAMESASKMLETNKNNTENVSSDGLAAAQSVACNLRNIGDELCRVQSLHHRSRHQHCPQQRPTEVSIFR